jgi:filamentous hemagglutinin
MVAAFLLSRVPPIRVPSVGAPAPGPVPPPARALSAAEAEVVESIRDVNPTNGTTNCINCAIATEYTIRGSPSSAVPSYPKLNLLDVEERFGTLRPVSGPAEIEDALLRSGPGSTGIISGESAIPGQIGHVFNVANPDGTALFLDGQVGRLGDYNFFTLRDLKFILIRAGVSY